MVKKIKKYVKFMVCMALIAGLIAPSYAALSASDGSAFVTKAEFDSALADFNARLTTFEAGINSKIDSQVTSYLDRNGIWNGKEQQLTTTYRHSSGYIETWQPAREGVVYATRSAYWWKCWDKIKLIDNVSKSGLAFITFENGVSACPAGIGAMNSADTAGSFQLAQGWSQDEPPQYPLTYLDYIETEPAKTQAKAWIDKWGSTLLITGDTNPIDKSLIDWDGSSTLTWHHGYYTNTAKYARVKEWAESNQFALENPEYHGGVYSDVRNWFVMTHLMWPTGAHTTSMFLEKGKPLWFSTWFRAVNSWSGSPSSNWPPGSSHVILFKQRNSKSRYTTAPNKEASDSIANECFWFSSIKVY